MEDNMQYGGISRVRIADVPIRKTIGQSDDIVRRVVANAQAGIGPHEAIDVPVPEPNSVKDNPTAGHYLLGKLNKAITEYKLPVDAFRAEGKDDGKWHIYVVGRADR